VRGSRLSGSNVWEVVHSLFNRKIVPPRVPVVALVVSEEDRLILSGTSSEEPLDIRFAESGEEAYTLANRLTAPIILVDRDWPGIEWRTAVASLAALPHQACVILMSGVSDDYLWQELIRTGGYDVLPKPLRPDNLARVVKLALSYQGRVS
jgi:DNA-binding NtrC family response regulator